ncbi:MAG TPA: hypothetical protein VF834_16950 [Streptosporangiaceae bacterium]
MSTITPRLSMAIGRADMAIAKLHSPLATATSATHTLLVPGVLGIIASVIVLRLIVRVNAELANLLTQVLRTMAAIGRMVTTVVVTAGVAVIILLHH